MGQEIISQPQQFNSPITINSSLTVIGQISSNNIIGNSNQWNSVYSSVNTNSATTWNYQGTDLKGLSSNWQNTFSKVSSTSANWDSVYSSVNTNSGNWVTTSNLQSNYLNLTGGTISGNLTITGNLSTLGTTTQIDTQVFVTSAVSVTNTGTGPALTVKQTGSQDIATFFDDSTTALIIKDGGNVGIGTSSPISKLNVVADNENALRISNNDTHEYYASFGCTLSAGYFTAGTALVRDVPLIFRTSLGGAETERVRFAANGNVGIGTSSPNEKLTVSGNISATGNVIAQGQFLFSDGTVSAPSIANNGDANNGIYFPSTDTLGFVTGGIERLRISDTGTVTLSTYAANDALRITQSGTGNAFIVEDSENPDSTAFVITSSGNVGVGISSPNAKLTVSGGISATGDVSVNTGSRLNLATSSTGMSIYRDGGNNGMAFSNGNLTRMFIDDAGDVGIGTTAPNEILTVVGNISATGNLTIDGNATLGSNASDTLTFNGGPVNYPNATTAADGIVIGTDVNLYRSAANILRTDDALSVGQDLSAADIYSTQSTFELFNSTKNKLSIESGKLSFTNNTGIVAASIATNGTTTLGDLRVGVSNIDPDASLSIDSNSVGLYFDEQKGIQTVSVGLYNLNSSSYNGTSNTVFGIVNGNQVTTGNYNNFFGQNAASYLTTGSSNVYIGYASGGANDTGSNNINIGMYSGGGWGNSSNSVCIGHEAGRSLTNNSSIAIGYQAYGLVASSANSGANNTAVGFQSLYSIESTATGNTALGTLSLAANSTGSYNVAVGAAALQDSTTGIGNIGIGYQAGVANTTGHYNIAIGYQALDANTLGNYNHAIGRSALGSFNNTFGTGGNNVAIGYNSLVNTNPTANTNGVNNTAIGVSAGDANTTGFNNTFIGYDAGGSIALSGSNNTIIGNGATPSGPGAVNEITLGNASITSLRCNDQTIAALSDSRDKIKVRNLELGLEFLNSLRPVKFEWKTREGSAKDGTQEAGFIAQELLEAQSKSNCKDYLKIVNESNPDRLEAAYARLIPVLVKSIQELSEQNKKLTEEIELLKTKIN